MTTPTLPSTAASTGGLEPPDGGGPPRTPGLRRGLPAGPRGSVEPIERTADVGGLAIAFDERVLEPRPWTALQGVWAAELAAAAPAGPILELCAGAGHIGLVALSRSDRDLVQIDVDPVACAFARRNADAAGLGARVEVRCGSITSALEAHERYPVIIADPPYIPSGEIGRFPADPTLAIDGGEDGLSLVRLCLDAVRAVLAPDGVALLQLGRVDHIRRVVEHGAGDLVVADRRRDRADRHVVALRRPTGTPAGSPPGLATAAEAQG